MFWKKAVWTGGFQKYFYKIVGERRYVVEIQISATGRHNSFRLYTTNVACDENNRFPSNWFMWKILKKIDSPNLKLAFKEANQVIKGNK